MANSSNWKAVPATLARDPRTTMRIVVGALLVAILVAAAFVFRPWEGSVQDMERALGARRAELAQRKTALTRLQALVEKVGNARDAGDEFLGGYFLDRDSAYSNLLSDLNQMANSAGVRPRDHDFGWEPIEGSENLSILTINANYEGSYADLIQFVNAVDRSSRLLIIDTLQAAPLEGQQTEGLRIRLRIHAFVREPQPQAPLAAANTTGGGGGQ